MNRTRMAALAAGLILAVSTVAGAEEGTLEKIGQKADEKIAEMKRNLKLTPEQEEKVKTILREKSDNVKKFAEDADRRIREALTPEQRRQYDSMKKS